MKTMKTMNIIYYVFILLYCAKKLHFLTHGVTLVKPLSRQYYTMFRDIFLR